MKKRVVVLGSTGSIGENTVRVLAHFPDRFEVVGLAAKRQTARLAEQAAELHAKVVVTGDERRGDELKRLAPPGVTAAAGLGAMTDLAARPDVDIVVCAVVGTTGFKPVAEAIRQGKQIALASKEIMVMGGEWINALLDRHPSARIVPVDSEHSAIFQCLAGRAPDEVAKLVLTASGGPFRTATDGEIRKATWEKAMKHPTWNMGAKVTIDSASLMNKALELVEARPFAALYLLLAALARAEVVFHEVDVGRCRRLEREAARECGAIRHSPSPPLPFSYSTWYVVLTESIVSGHGSAWRRWMRPSRLLVPVKSRLQSFSASVTAVPFRPTGRVTSRQPVSIAYGLTLNVLASITRSSDSVAFLISICAVAPFSGSGRTLTNSETTGQPMA